MVGSKFTKLVEKNSEELSLQLAHKLHSSSRTKGFHNLPLADLVADVHYLYHNLGDWLLYRTEDDVRSRYAEIGRRRALQQITSEELMWGFTMAKEHIISFLQREAAADNALALFGELEFVMALSQFFDRAIYFALAAQRTAIQQEAVA
jgi:hypothetical protein